MSDQSDFDPYAGNILNQGLGRILTRGEVLTHLTFLPPIPHEIAGMPKHIRIHLLMRLGDLHIASLEGAKLHQTVDLMIRESYRYRDPMSPQTPCRHGFLPDRGASAQIGSGTSSKLSLSATATQFSTLMTSFRL